MKARSNVQKGVILGKTEMATQNPSKNDLRLDSDSSISGLMRWFANAMHRGTGS